MPRGGGEELAPDRETAGLPPALYGFLGQVEDVGKDPLEHRMCEAGIGKLLQKIGYKTCVTGSTVVR